MRVWPLLAVALVVGCAPAQEAMDDVARAQAKGVVTPIVERNFPGTNATVVSDCVIDNASAGEILSIAQASVTGVDERTLKTVSDIIQRPDTINCVFRQGVFLFPEASNNG